jgi:hypothetical protein
VERIMPFKLKSGIPMDATIFPRFPTQLHFVAESSCTFEPITTFPYLHDDAWLSSAQTQTPFFFFFFLHLTLPAMDECQQKKSPPYLYCAK